MKITNTKAAKPFKAFTPTGPGAYVGYTGSLIVIPLKMDFPASNGGIFFLEGKYPEQLGKSTSAVKRVEIVEIIYREID